MKVTDTHKIYQILHDKKFIDWIIEPSAELEEYWNKYIQQNPQDQEIIKEARIILNGVAQNQGRMKEQEIHQLWYRIDTTLANRRKQNIFTRRWMAAASILILIGFSGWMFQHYYLKEEPVIDYSAVVRAEPASNDVTLILSDSKQETFSSKEVDIKYNESGLIVTGTGEVLSAETEKSDKTEEQLNQLVVPFGKHSSITLSDGTKLWLNSGSRAIYPVTFNKKYREIFIEGEAYLEVAKNASQPFYVKTDKINVRVLGTKFNVSAYPEDARSSVVLVEGSVEAVAGKKSFAIKPNQVFKFEKESGLSTLENANVMEYISWKDGWLLCNKEKLGDIAVKLSRYYNINIEVVDQKVKELTLSGKLDFKTHCEDVLNTIALTAPVKYEIENEVIKLRLK